MNPFALAYRERQQLFIFDRTYILGTFLKVGGLATLLSRFIVQFFWNPTVALVLTLLSLALSAYMTWAIVRKSRNDWSVFPLCVIPSLFIGASLSDNSLHFDYFTAILLVQAGLLIYKGIKSHRTLWGVLLTIILYFTAGSAAVIFAVSAAVPDSWRHSRLDRESHFPWTLLSIVAVALCGIVSYALALVPTWSEAFTPALYYDLDASLPVMHWAGWVTLSLVVICAGLAKPVPSKGWITVVSRIALLGVLFVPASKFSMKIEEKQPSLAYVFEHYAANEDWDGLVKSCGKAPWLPRTANYLNMALAWKGELSERLLEYDQRGPQSLVMTTKDRAVDVAQAHLMFTMGNVAAAQDVAFNSLSSLQGFCPDMVKLNAQVELMRGSYEVADKYLSLLEKAPRYRKWARKYRGFIFNDDAVEADPLLGNGRRNLAAENSFIMYTDPMSELFPILDANPKDERALEYGLCYLLLAKDLNSVKRFITDYYSSPESPELPRIAQEAMVFYSEYSRNMEGIEPFGLDWCYEHGVKPETVKRFEEYQRAAVAGPVSLKKFRGTYWYYLVHTEI